MHNLWRAGIFSNTKIHTSISIYQTSDLFFYFSLQHISLLFCFRLATFILIFVLFFFMFSSLTFFFSVFDLFFSVFDLLLFGTASRKRVLRQEYGCNNYYVGYLTTSRWSPYPILQIPESKELCKIQKQVVNLRNASAALHLRNAVLSSSYVSGRTIWHGGPDYITSRAVGCRPLLYTNKALCFIHCYCFCLFLQ